VPLVSAVAFIDECTAAEWLSEATAIRESAIGSRCTSG
jgi:hypothetical protein